MTETRQHQLRIHTTEVLADLLRRVPEDPALRPLTEILARHDAVPVSQLDAFEAYAAETEREGGQDSALYRWTRATLDDPEKRRRHATAFALRIGGQEVYAKAAADALEAALQPLVGSPLVRQLTRHNTNPATNLPVPPEYRR